MSTRGRSTAVDVDGGGGADWEVMVAAVFGEGYEGGKRGQLGRGMKRVSGGTN